MLTQEDLKALSSLMDNKLEPINKRLDHIEETLEEVKEDGKITREVTNMLVQWVEFYYGKEKPFPVDEDEIENQDKILKMID